MRLLTIFLFVICSINSESDNLHTSCYNKRSQSPVDLSVDTAKVEYTSHIMPFYSSQPINLINKENIIKGTFATYTMSVSGAMLEEEYVLDYMELHWPSEHLIENKEMALELQLYHYALSHNNSEKARKAADGYVAVAVFFEVYSKNEKLDPFFSALEFLRNHESTHKLTFNPSDFLPDNTELYFRYRGSFTHSYCEESVIWIVLTKAVKISQAQYDKVKDIKNSKGQFIEFNNRDPQELHERRPTVTSEYINSATNVVFCKWMILVLAITLWDRP